MYIVACRYVLLLRSAHSLKEKRGQVRRMQARLWRTAGVVLHEVAALDMWQRVEVGFAVVNATRRTADTVADQAERCLLDACAEMRLIAKARRVFELAEPTGLPTMPAWESGKAGTNSFDGVSRADAVNVGATDFVPPSDWLRMDEGDESE